MTQQYIVKFTSPEGDCISYLHAKTPKQAVTRFLDSDLGARFAYKSKADPDLIKKRISDQPFNDCTVKIGGWAITVELEARTLFDRIASRQSTSKGDEDAVLALAS